MANHSYTEGGSTPQKAINLKEIKKIAKLPNSCIEIVVEEKVVSLPWSFLGRVHDGIDIFMERLLYFYQNSLSGVPIARGKTRLVDSSALVRYMQPEFHFTVKVEFAVFRPRFGTMLPAHVVRVDEGQIVCSIYGVILANVWLSMARYRGSKRPSYEGPIPAVGDVVTLRTIRGRIFKGYLQLEAEIVGTDPRTTFDQRLCNFQVDTNQPVACYALPDVVQSAHVARNSVNTKKRFSDDEDESVLPETTPKEQHSPKKSKKRKWEAEEDFDQKSEKSALLNYSPLFAENPADQSTSVDGEKKMKKSKKHKKHKGDDE